MMLDISLYLTILLPDGSCVSENFRRFDLMKKRWLTLRSATPRACALAHVGFWRPKQASEKAVLSGKEGFFLMTEGGFFAFPPDQRGEANAFVLEQDIRFCRSISGWGYSADLTPAAPRVLPDALVHQKQNSATGWIKATQDAGSPAASILCRENFSTDEDYLLGEMRLSFDDQKTLAAERFFYFCGNDLTSVNVFDALHFLPPSLGRTPLTILNLPFRCTKALKEVGVHCVSDLHNYKNRATPFPKKMGLKSQRELTDELENWLSSVLPNSLAHKEGASLNGGPPIIFAHPDTIRKSVSLDNLSVDELLAMKGVPKNFDEAIDLIFNDLRAHHEQWHFVLSRRSGFLPETESLQEIGDTLNLTRERIRQMEASGIYYCKKNTPWRPTANILLSRLFCHQEKIGQPVLLTALDQFCPWFFGVDKKATLFEFFAEHFFDQTVSVHTIKGHLFLSRIKKDDFDFVARRAREIIADGAISRLPVETLKSEFFCLFSGPGKDIRETIWDVELSTAILSENEVGQFILSSRITLDGLLKATLTNSPTPLSAAHVFEKIRAIHPNVESKKNIHSSLSRLAILFDRGVFGLDCHLPKNDEQTLAAIVSAAENLLFKDADSRRRSWHVSEILEAISFEEPDVIGDISPWLADYYLRSSPRLKRLGKLMWAINGDESFEFKTVSAMAIEILLSHGSPMKHEEILERMKKDRGIPVNKFFAIRPNGPLIKIARGEWGLIDRDLPFGKTEGALLMDSLFRILTNRGKGIHFSEIIDFLATDLDIGLRCEEPSIVVGLTEKDSRFRMSAGRYLYLSSWAACARVSPAEGLKTIFSAQPDLRLNPAELRDRLEKIIERPVDSKWFAYTCAIAGAVFKNGFWQRAGEDKDDGFFDAD